MKIGRFGIIYLKLLPDYSTKNTYLFDRQVNMNQLKLILLIGCLTSFLFTELANAHFRLGRGMERAGALPLDERRAAPFDAGFQDAHAEAKREMLLKRLENLLDKYETRVRRSEETEN